MELRDPRQVRQHVAGHPTYHVNVIKLKMRDYMDIPGYLTYLDPDVEKVECVIHRINHYLLDNAIGFPNTYPLVACVAGGIVWMRD